LGRIAEVIHEAAACGLPVIARKNYQPETVVDGQTGYLVARMMNYLSISKNCFAGLISVRRLDALAESTASSSTGIASPNSGEKYFCA
jgi:hypothetical protein